MSDENDLNDLLGSSDDENEDAEMPSGNGETNNNELNDLLGDSDHSDTEDKIDPVSAEDARSKDLDLILGANNSVHVALELKATSSSKLSLPGTFDIQKEDSTFVFKIPNFIKLQSDEYERASHNIENEKIQFGKTTAVVRWRIKRDSNGEAILDASGNPVKESNARMIKWDDGTFQLVVGDAVFDAKMTAADNCYIYEHLKSVDNSMEGDQDIHEETCLKCIGDIQNKMILVPTSIKSETHLKMSLHISDTHKKEQKISIRDYEKITENPEKTLHDLARREDDQNRRDKKLRQQAEYRMGGGVSTGGGGRYGSGSRRPSMSAEYLNDDSQFEGENLAQLKKAAKSSSRKYADEVEDDEEGPVRHAKRSQKSAYDEEDDEDMIDDDDDEEEDEEEEEDDEEEEEEEEDEEEPVRKSSKSGDLDRKPKAKRAQETVEDSVEDGGDDDEEVMQQQRNKRVKRTIVESDEDE